MLGFTTAGLSVTVVNLAFPKMMTSLRADLDVMQGVQTGYMIMQAVMMPSVGWLGARLGNRKLYLLSLGGFVGGSILCGMAWDVYSPIAFRLVQAMCVGPLFPLTQVILFQTFPGEKRGLAMGVSSLGFSFGPMVGPVLGGYLLEFASWRAVFYINVPVGILGLFLAYCILPRPPPQQRRLDVGGVYQHHQLHGCQFYRCPVCTDSPRLHPAAGRLDAHAFGNRRWPPERLCRASLRRCPCQSPGDFRLDCGCLLPVSITTITTWTSACMLTFWLTARGFARAFTIAPLSAASLAALPEAEVRMGSGLLSLNRGIASASSVALTATVFQHRLATRAMWLVQDQSLAASGQEELLQSLHLTFERLGDFSSMAGIKALATLQRLVYM
jgi:MFS family permease